MSPRHEWRLVVLLSPLKYWKKAVSVWYNVDRIRSVFNDFKNVTNAAFS